MYKIIIENGNEVFVQPSENVAIPIDEGNSDYQAYLAWVAEGNEPEIIEI